MTKTNKILLGIATFLPLIFVIAYMVFFFTAFMNIPFENPEALEDDPRRFFTSFATLAGMIILAVIFGLGLLIYYVIHAARNPKFDDTQRLIWIVVLIFANGIGSIVYFFMNIVPLPEPNSESENPLITKND